MAINLQKGQKIDIGPAKMSVGLGWTPHEGTGFDFDLDASAFMVDANRQIPAEEFFVFYSNTDSPDKALHHTGDDPTGGNSAEGDDEVIQVDLTKIDSRIQEILLQQRVSSLLLEWLQSLKSEGSVSILDPAYGQVGTTGSGDESESGGQA